MSIITPLFGGRCSSFCTDHLISYDVDGSLLTDKFRSLEEFMKTSSIGEFRKRLQLMFAFLGQLTAGIRRGCYSRFGSLILFMSNFYIDAV